jgi:hypothetical protein
MKTVQHALRAAVFFFNKQRGGKALRTGQAACRKEMTNMTFLKQKTSKVTH